MIKESFRGFSKSARDHFYRCSGCGKLVDHRNANDVEIHRQHVLNRQPGIGPTTAGDSYSSGRKLTPVLGCAFESCGPIFSPDGINPTWWKSVPL
jgi:hypothetical protein